MRLLNVLTFTVTALVTMSVSVQDAHAVNPACRSQDFNYKNTVRRERTANTDLGREQRTLDSLVRRMERDVENALRKQQQCQDNVDRKRDSYDAQLDRLEDQRRRYASQIVEITAQRIECELSALAGRYCDVNRFYTQINRIMRTITLVETRIPALRDSLNQRLATEEAKCERQNLRNQTTVARSQARIDKQTPRVTAKTAAAAAATAAREAAEAALAVCTAAHP